MLRRTLQPDSRASKQQQNRAAAVVHAEGKTIASLRHIRIALLPLVLACAGCGAADDGSAPRATLETDAAGATLIAVDGEALIDGSRPQLILVCKPGQPPSLRLDLIRPPTSRPPAREVFAQVQAKGGTEVTIELDWLEGGRWQVRTPDPAVPETIADRENQRRLSEILYAFSRERLLYLTPPAAYAPAGRLTWNPRALGEHLAAAQRCAFTERPTI